MVRKRVIAIIVAVISVVSISVCMSACMKETVNSQETIKQDTTATPDVALTNPIEDTVALRQTESPETPSATEMVQDLTPAATTVEQRTAEPTPETTKEPEIAVNTPSVTRVPVSPTNRVTPTPTAKPTATPELYDTPEPSDSNELPEF